MKNPYERNINIFVLIFVILTILISSLALANDVSPEEKVKNVFTNIEAALIPLKSANQLSRSNIRVVLEQYLLPEVSTQYFSHKVLGLHLAKLSPEHKEAFRTELTSQLLNTYSHLLSKYDNEAINIGTSSLSKSGKVAMVNMTIIGKNKSNKAILKLIKLRDETWLFYDIVVEGISMLESKQKEINASLNKLGPEQTLIQLQNIRGS
ncbi:ABC transporter substrate-binding protein [Colwellia sp. 1_MG-2023]|uniref:MlaC/ttg2D family ABC transporter substrate-binding protein n=1 Tax=Colwellia sp. 1_MG-2023 TaxID=3062649 RepID=UPI0026E24533|nr:ABC transporter substrate-binding protein [Colwellia sp. 1_MG-2023]MDO6446326.1 ABC transporter substrate-binding protein [Colwellia sp. 1_MG-2023]